MTVEDKKIATPTKTNDVVNNLAISEAGTISPNPTVVMMVIV